MDVSAALLNGGAIQRGTGIRLEDKPTICAAHEVHATEIQSARVRGGESQSRRFCTNRPGFFERRPLRQIGTPLARSWKPSQPMHNFTIHDQCAKIIFYGNFFLNNGILIIDRRIGRK